MIRDTELDKRSNADLPMPLRMLGDTDVGVIMDAAETLPTGAKILEVGPWLGGLTCMLPNHAEMTVVDSFVWSNGNDANYPGIATAGQSFRSLFEANMAAYGIAPRIIETTLPELDWPGGDLDFVVIDIPLNVERLHGCLSAIAAAIKPGAKVIVKNALNARTLGAGAYVDALLGLGLFKMRTTEQPKWCNIAVLTATDKVADLSQIEDINDAMAAAPICEGFTDPWYGSTLSVFRIAYLALIDRWGDACAALLQLPKSSDNLQLWDSVELMLFEKAEPDIQMKLAVLSELFWLSNNTSLEHVRPIKIEPHFAGRIKAFWRNNEGSDWLLENADLTLLGAGISDLKLNELAPFTQNIHQSKVVEIGSNIGAGALAALLAGAQTYLGVEKSDRSDSATQLSTQFAHINVTLDEEDAIEAVTAADVLILGAGAEEQETRLGTSIASRLTEKTDNVTIIRV